MHLVNLSLRHGLPLKAIVLGIFLFSQNSPSVNGQNQAAAGTAPDVKINIPGANGGLPIEIETLVPGLEGYKFHLVPDPTKSPSVQIGSTDGDADEQPAHPVTVNSVYVGISPISNTQYEAIPDPNDPETGPNRKRGTYSKGDNQPVTLVNYIDATGYIGRVNLAASKIGQPKPVYSLPREVECEAAARESGSAKYPWGNDITDADKKFYSKSSATDVDKNIRGGLIFNHMVGNVFCWCQEWYSKNAYSSSPTIENKTKVLRGGKWYSYEKSLRCADRWNAFPDTKSEFIGIRICRDTTGLAP